MSCRYRSSRQHLFVAAALTLGLAPVGSLAHEPLMVGDLLVSGAESLGTSVGPGQLYRYRNGDFTLLEENEGGLGAGRMAVGRAGEVYIVGLFGQGVYRYDVVTEAAIEVFGSLNLDALTVGPDGELYVAQFRTVSVVDQATGGLTPFVTVPDSRFSIGGIQGIVFDAAGNLYIAGESIFDGTDLGQVLKYSAGTLRRLVPTGCQNGGLCAVSDVSITGDGTLIASDFTDDQVVSFDPVTGAITGSAPLDRAGTLAGALGKTAFSMVVPFPSALVTQFGSLDIPASDTDLITAPVVLGGLATVLSASADTDGDGMPDAYETDNGFDPGDPSDAARDEDGDGFTNVEEYVAGTDPRDFSSVPPTTLVTVIFEGEIQTIDPALTSGPFNVGDPIQGAYIYESDPEKNPDRNAQSDTLGQYVTSRTAPLTVAGTTYPTGNGFGIAVFGNSATVAHGFDVAFDLAEPDIGPARVDSVSVSLRDLDNTVFPSIDPPSPLPALTEFETRSLQLFYFDSGLKRIDASLTRHQDARSVPGDFDGDGVDNADDGCPIDFEATVVDTDGDGRGNVCDEDDDNDGVADIDDPFPLDHDESMDTDNDGIGNNADPDDDNDGVADGDDAFPLDPLETTDTDNDGVGDNADEDDDNDGMPDAYELSNGLDPADAADALDDDDTDGFSNLGEFRAGTDPQNASSSPGTDTSADLVSALLPTSRSTTVGQTATAFASLINLGAAAQNCVFAPTGPLAAQFSFWTTDPATNVVNGAANEGVSIANGATQSYVFALTPRSEIVPEHVGFSFTCTGRARATTTIGLNTLLFSASNDPVPDVVALALTATGDGIVNVPGATGTGAFAVASVNVGTGGDLTVSANTGASTLPVGLTLCQTNPASGVCENPAVPSATVAVTLGPNETPTFSIFVTGAGDVPFDPANNRVFVQFDDAGGAVRGSTSVAVRTTQ